MSNQELRQQSVRASTGTAYSYEGDWMALFGAAGITSGVFNERMLAWINAQLSSAYTNVNDAMRAFAVSQGVTTWNELGTFTVGVGSGPTGAGIFLEDGTSFLLAENSDYLILEQV